MPNDPHNAARERLRALVAGGAEVEQRAVTGEVLAVVPVANDTARVERIGDDLTVWLRPIGRGGAGDPRPLPAARLDLVGDAVGVQHPAGTYSLVRPAAPSRVGGGCDDGGVADPEPLG